MRIALCGLLLCAAAQAQETTVMTQTEVEVVEGDVLLIEKLETLPKEGPRNGIKKSDVIRIYGEPVSRNAPVGQPPISHWVYPEFTVYFEYDTVLHSVTKV